MVSAGPRLGQTDGRWRSGAHHVLPPFVKTPVLDPCSRKPDRASRIGFLLYIPLRLVVFGRQPSRQVPMAGKCNAQVSSLTRNEKLDRI